MRRAHYNAAMTAAGKFRVGEWVADTDACLIRKDGVVKKLEPKTADLLALLIAHRGEVVSRGAIVAALWPDVTVGEDALPQAVSRLRKALADNPKAPRYVETAPKRGYRLIAPSAPVDARAEKTGRAAGLRLRPVAIGGGGLLAALFAGVLALSALGDGGPASAAVLATERADDRYMQFTRADNETAIALYEQAIADEPGYAPAHAGLANALVQRAVRWRGAAGGEPAAATLGAALASERLRAPQAREVLYRAQALAERAVRLSPQDADALKALGLVYAAQGKLGAAVSAHQRAVALDPGAWPALVNLGELHDIKGDRAGALAYLEKAYAAMDRAYDAEPQRIGLWHAKLGAEIGARHLASGDLQAAEFWHRRVLKLAPLEPSAAGLARVLKASGDAQEGRRLCADLIARIGNDNACGRFLAEEA